jgi:hypothetical protein
LGDLNSESIICTSIYEDDAKFWVYTLIKNKKAVYKDEDWIIYYSDFHRIYLFFFIGRSSNANLFIDNHITPLLHNKNRVHLILRRRNEYNDVIIDRIENNRIDGLLYSLVNYDGENFSDGNPHELSLYKKMSYLFTGTIPVRKGPDENISTPSKWVKENQQRCILDYKYNLTYFYFLFGFNHFQRGEQQIEISNRMNRVFLYSKTHNPSSERTKLIVQALKTDKIFNKKYSEEDWFWYTANYNTYHLSYFLDYNMCKFNLVTESVDVTEMLGDGQARCIFVTEKTLKALSVSTPAYVLLTPDVYKALSEYGFYFLNDEFGEYSDISNYGRFTDFLKGASEEDLDNLFKKSFEKSKRNKPLLESYIYSDKKRELDLLTRRY